MVSLKSSAVVRDPRSMQAIIEERWSLKGCIIDHRSLVPKLQSEEEMRRLVPKLLRFYIDRMAAGSKRAPSQKQTAAPGTPGDGHGSSKEKTLLRHSEESKINIK
jgi:hypothetical protein